MNKEDKYQQQLIKIMHFAHFLLWFRIRERYEGDSIIKNLQELFTHTAYYYDLAQRNQLIKIEIEVVEGFEIGENHAESQSFPPPFWLQLAQKYEKMY